MSKTHTKQTESFFDLLEEIGEEKKNKRSKEWRTYKVNNYTILLNVTGDFVKIPEIEEEFNNISFFKKFIRTDVEIPKNTLKKNILYKKKEKEDVKQKVEKAVKLASKWDKIDEDEPHFEFTNDARGIKKQILNYYVKNKWIKKRKKNVYFVVNSIYGVTGLYYLPATLKGEKKYVKNSIKGLITLNKITNKTKHIVIAESPIDALSYIQLKQFKLNKTCILATGGTISADAEATLKKIIKYIKQKQFKPEIILTFDNDKTGRQFAKRVTGIFKESGISVETDFPLFKDWNEQLNNNKYSLFAGI